MPCNYCPFVSMCWPKPTSDNGTPQSATIDPDNLAAVASLASEYLWHSAIAKKHYAARDNIKPFLAGMDAVVPNPQNPEYELNREDGRRESGQAGVRTARPWPRNWRPSGTHRSCGKRQRHAMCGSAGARRRRGSGERQVERDPGQPSMAVRKRHPWPGGGEPLPNHDPARTSARCRCLPQTRRCCSCGQPPRCCRRPCR